MPGVVESAGATPSQRKKLFYGVCVPLRLLLAYLVYRTYSFLWVQGIVLSVSLLSVYLNILGLNSSNEIWWSQKFHLVLSSKIVFCLVAGRSEFVPYLMLLDVFFGVMTSLARDPWTGDGI
ncbi:unnamed protein product [Sphacelaria rigidula]